MIHLFTYVVLMGAGLGYGVVNLIHLWSTNKVVFWVGIFVAILNVVNGIIQSLDPTEIQLWWLLLYILPAVLLVFGDFAGIQEIGSPQLAELGVTLQPGMLGKSSDYEAAIKSHYFSLVYPFIAAVAAKLAYWCVSDEA